MRATTLRSRGARSAAPVLATLFAFSMLAGPGTAGAAANKAVVATGTGNTTCPTAITEPATTINVNATRSKGIVQGSVQVNDPTFTTAKFGSIRNGSISGSSFTLTAFITTDRCMGVTYPTPVNATISGDCGTGVLITYIDDNGETGQYVGNATCS